MNFLLLILQTYVRVVGNLNCTMLLYPIETCILSFSLWYPKFTFKWLCDANWNNLWWNSYLQLWYRLHSDRRHHSDMSNYRVVVWECTHLPTYVAVFWNLKNTVLLSPYSFQQLWIAALWLTLPMAKSATPVEPLLDKLPPTAVIQATVWLERVLACVKLIQPGLALHPLVNVSCNTEIWLLMLHYIPWKSPHLSMSQQCM